MVPVSLSAYKEKFGFSQTSFTKYNGLKKKSKCTKLYFWKGQLNYD